MKAKNNKNNPPEKTQKEIEVEKLSSFFDKYISKGNLVTKNASLLGIKRVTYIKGKDLKQFFTENFVEIKKEIFEILKIDLGKEANKDSLQKFYQLNQQRNIFNYLQRIPGDKAKYPKKLIPLKKTDDKNLQLIFSETGFYLLNINKSESRKPIIYLILLVILILFIVLFPIWPLNVKLGVLYFLMGLLIFLIAFLILIIIIAFIGVLFGYDIDFMPNIDNVKLGWKKRLFDPFITIEGREDPCCFKIIRYILIFSLVNMGIIAYFYPTIPKESYYMLKKMIVYLFSYARKKIEDIHYNRNAVKVRQTHNLDDLNNL